MNGNLRIVFPMKQDKKASRQTAPVTTAQPADTPINALIKRIEERCYADLVEACRWVCYYHTNMIFISIARQIDLALGIIEESAIRIPC